MDIQDIADERDMSTITIEGHIIKLFEDESLTEAELLSLVKSSDLKEITKTIIAHFPE